MKLRVALAQMHIAPGRPQDNFRQAQQWAEAAADQGAELLLLPELWLSGYDLARSQEHARSFQEEYQGRWAALARTTGMFLCGSVLALDPAGRPANTALLLSPAGELLAAYRKVHLFEPMGEVRYLAAGDTLPSFDLPWGRTAMAICYDLRFPEPFRRYMLGGAELVLLVAQWPQPRVEHWRTLLRTRAIENQIFVAACNRVGEDPNGTVFGGHSAVIGPWGEVLVEGSGEEALLLATLDLGAVQETRARFPLLGDRREDLYGPGEEAAST